jgi:hypothetical protein
MFFDRCLCDQITPRQSRETPLVAFWLGVFGGLAVNSSPDDEPTD